MSHLMEQIILLDKLRDAIERAEAAEALNAHLEMAVRKAEGVSESLRRRAEDAENKLLFTRPAPAVNLAELVNDDTKRMDWLVSKVVNVRQPLPYGSRDIFWSQQSSEDCDENYISDLRDQIDAILRNIEG